MRYLASSPVRVVGAVTGQRYDFSGERPEQAVDARDAAVLLATPHFARSPRM
ncbi:MAG: hypothetical protein U1F52_20980 [Burkholderiales bacterium]